MKQFLNVLYRRILYKIPLKFLLILLAIFAVLIASVKADNVSVFDIGGVIWDGGDITAGGTWQSSVNFGNIICVQNRQDSRCNSITLTIGGVDYTGDPYFGESQHNVFCLKGVNGGFTLTNNANRACRFYVGRFDSSELLEDMTSLQCQTEYNLIPISSVDQNYCTTNNLCPAYDCPINTGSISTLYINDILHVGSPFIYMNIPEEIGWDYAYTQGGTNMFIDVEGYNVDYDKIAGILEVQNYKPTSEDFTQVVSNLTPYVKIMVFVLFIFIIWKWIRGGFKSKLK